MVLLVVMYEFFFYIILNSLRRWERTTKNYVGGKKERSFAIFKKNIAIWVLIGR